MIKTPEPEDESPIICPMTGMVCMTEHGFCEDYFCARVAGIDVDGDLYR